MVNSVVATPFLFIQNTFFIFLEDTCFLFILLAVSLTCGDFLPQLRRKEKVGSVFVHAAIMKWAQCAFFTFSFQAISVPFFVIWREQKYKRIVDTVSIHSWLTASDGLMPSTSEHRPRLILHIHHRGKDWLFGSTSLMVWYDLTHDATEWEQLCGTITARLHNTQTHAHTHKHKDTVC